MKAKFSMIAMGVLLCIPRVASGWEAQGKSTYKNQTTEYKAAVANHVTSLGEHPDYRMSVYLYPLSFTEEQRKTPRNWINPSRVRQLMDEAGFDQDQHTLYLQFGLKEPKKNFGIENVKWASCQWVGPRLGLDNAGAVRSLVRNFHVDKLDEGGTVSFDLTWKRGPGDTSNVLPSEPPTSVSVRVKAAIVISSVLGGPKDATSGNNRSALAEIEIRAKPKVSIAKLEAGTARMSGRTKGRIDSVGGEVVGAQFVRVPWQSTPTYSIKVTKGGYLYAMKGGRDLLERGELKWEERPEAVSGPYLPAAHRIAVRAGETLSMSGWELSLVAAKISTK